MGTVRAFPHSDEHLRFSKYLGMVLFLASWTMMFASLFFAYVVVRSRATSWPPLGSDPLPLALPGFNTAVLVASSVTLHAGVRDLRRGRAQALARWLLATLALGTLFLALQGHVWRALWRGGLRIDSGIYGSVFYGFTGFHALHVLTGLGVLAWLLHGAWRGRFTAREHVPLRLGAMFWHFVDVVWVLLFVAVYVL